MGGEEIGGRKKDRERIGKGEEIGEEKGTGIG